MTPEAEEEPADVEPEFATAYMSQPEDEPTLAAGVTSLFATTGDDQTRDDDDFFASDEAPDDKRETASVDREPDEAEEDLSFLPARRSVFGDWPEERPNLLGPTGAAVGAGAMAAEGDRIRFGSDLVGGMPPPRRPWQRFWQWANEDDRRTLALFAVLGGLTVLFGYLGFAVGSSIQGGGGNGGEIPALATQSEGTATIPCGDPTVLEQGRDATLTFDSPRLSDYELVGVNVRANSPDASRQAVDAVLQPGKKVLFTARTAPGPAGRTDEYRLTVTFRRAEERVISDCAVHVKAPSGTGTGASTPAPTATVAVQATTPPQPTSPPAATPTPRPPTATPPPPTATPVPPTNTPALCTPTPQPTPIGATPLPFPTFTPVPGPC
jgi:hypothetical protein